MAYTADEILSRFKQLEQIREPWDDLRQDVADYVLPTREDMDQTKEQGKQQGSKVYDSTPADAASIHIDGLYGYTISQATVWFRLRVGDEILDEDEEVRVWIQDTEERLYSALGRSNWYATAKMLYEDACIMGTGILYAEEDRKNARPAYTSIHPGEAYIAEDKYKRVDTVFRRFKTTARQVIQRFGEDKVSKTLLDLYQNNPYAEVDMLHAVFPRKDRDPSKLDSGNMPWASVYVELEGRSKGAGKILNESGYNEFPFVIWRYSVSGKEVYGRSPAMTALADIKSLNKMGKSMLAAGQMSVEPPLHIPEGMKGEQIAWKPRGKLYYKDPTTRIEPANTGTNYPIGVDRENQKRDAIRKAYKNDFFLTLSLSEREMTATEAIGRQSEQAAILGPQTGRLTSEALNSAIDITFAIEFEAGRITPPPQKLIDYYAASGREIKIEYVGPLVQSQKRHFATAGIQRGLESVLPLIAVPGFAEAIMDKINPDETIQELLESSGFPQKALRSDEEVAARRLERQRMALAQQQAAEMMEMTEGIKNMAQADKDLGGGITEQLAEAV